MSQCRCTEELCLWNWLEYITICIIYSCSLWWCASLCCWPACVCIYKSFLFVRCQCHACPFNCTVDKAGGLWQIHLKIRLDFLKQWEIWLDVFQKVTYLCRCWGSQVMHPDSLLRCKPLTYYFRQWAVAAY